VNLNLARLFSSYRLLEQQLADERDRHEKAEERLRSDLLDERNERRRLQDRVLNKAGVLPVFEPSPSKMDSSTAVHRQRGARELAAAAGMARADTLYDSIEKEVKQFVAEQNKENGQAAGTTPGDQ
jgi:hypothetical protein